MSEQKLKNFRAGDRQRGHVRSHPPAAGAAPRPKEAEGEARFARLETLLDQEDPRAVGERLVGMLDNLEAYAQGQRGARAQAAAKHGRAAIERTIDLLDHLYRVRETLAQQASQGGAAASEEVTKP